MLEMKLILFCKAEKRAKKLPSSAEEGWLRGKEESCEAT